MSKFLKVQSSLYNKLRSISGSKLIFVSTELLKSLHGILGAHTSWWNFQQQQHLGSVKSRKGKKSVESFSLGIFREEAAAAGKQSWAEYRRGLSD